MKLVEFKVNDFINEVDSKRPAPGGGSVAALAGSLSSALARMVCHWTIGKKKFKALDEKTQELVFNAMNLLDLILLTLNNMLSHIKKVLTYFLL